jgi:pimeloyl-ACP methyl ester carboxylesterase
MKWLGRLSVVVVVLVAMLALLPPIVGPAFGLDSYRRSMPIPGQSIALPSGQHLNVVIEGSGAPIVLVHGLPGGASQMAPLAQALAREGFRAIRYDRMGWGHSSPRGDEPYSLAQNARELLALLDALGLQQADLIGYSFGGGVIQELARLAPNRIHAAALIASIGPTRRVSSPSAIRRIIFSAPMVMWSLSTQVTAMAAARGTFEALFYPDAISQPDIDAQLATLSLGDTIQTWVRESRDARGEFALLEPQALRSPVLLLHGTNDQIVPITVAHDLTAVIANSTLAELSDAGHGMVITRAENIAARIGRFMHRA